MTALRAGCFTRRSFLATVGLGAARLCSHRSRAVAATAGTENQGSSRGDLDAFVRARMESAHVPGLSLAIIRDGKLLRATGFGFSNLAQQRPMRADTLINVGSVTKTATCIAVMQLWEQKKFALDGDVNAYLSFPVRNVAHPSDSVTFRQLLTHTSSIADGPAYDTSYACGDSRVPLGRWLRDYLTAGGALYDRNNFHPWKPGMQFEYSNVAYGLLGYLVETLSGMSYSDYMLSRVFAPLGMSRSRILLAGMDPESHATPYTYTANKGDFASVTLRDPVWTPPADQSGGVQVPHCLYSWATPPDGLARTSAVELSRMLQAFMNRGEIDGQRVLRARTIVQILSDQHVAFAATQKNPHVQGLTWRVYRGLGTDVVWGHNGGDPGISTLVVFRPRDRRGAVVLMNSDEGSTTAAEIALRVLAQ